MLYTPSFNITINNAIINKIFGASTLVYLLLKLYFVDLVTQ